MASPPGTDEMARGPGTTTLSASVPEAVYERPPCSFAVPTVAEALLGITSSCGRHRDKGADGTGEELLPRDSLAADGSRRKLSAKVSRGKCDTKAPDDLLQIAHDDASTFSLAAAMSGPATGEDQKQEAGHSSATILPRREGASSAVTQLGVKATEAVECSSREASGDHCARSMKQRLAAKAHGSRTEPASCLEALRLRSVERAAHADPCSLSAPAPCGRRAKAVEGAESLPGESLFQTSLAGGRHEKDLRRPHTGDAASSPAAHPDKRSTPRHQQQSIFPPLLSTQTAARHCHSAGGELTRESDDTLAELLRRGGLECLGSTHRVQRCSSLPVDCAPPFEAQHTQPSDGEAVPSAAADKLRSFTFVQDCERKAGVRASAAAENWPALFDGATCGQTSKGDLTRQGGGSPAAVFGDANTEAKRYSHEDQAAAPLDSPSQRQAPQQDAAGKSQFRLVEPAYTNSAPVTGICVSRAGAAGFSREKDSSPSQVFSAAGAEARSRRSPYEKRSHTSPSTAAVPSARADCAAVGVCAHTGPENRYTRASISRANMFSKLSPSSEQDIQSDTQAEARRRNVLCAALRLKTESSSVAFFPKDLLPRRAGSGSALITPAGGVRHCASGQNDDGDTIEVAECEQSRAATYEPVEPLQVTGTTTRALVDTGAGTSAISTAAPAECFVLWRTPAGTHGNPAHGSVLSLTGPGNELQAREDGDEQPVQQLRSEGRQDVSNVRGRITFSALSPNMLSDGSSAAVPQSPVGLPDVATDILCACEPTTAQPRLTLLPPSAHVEYMHTSWAPYKNRAEPAAVCPAHVPTNASSGNFRNWQRCREQTPLLTVKPSACLLAKNAAKGMRSFATGFCTGNNVQTHEKMTPAGATFEGRLLSIASQSEENCSRSAIRTIPEAKNLQEHISSDSPAIKMKDIVGRRPREGVSDRREPLSLSSTTVATGAGSSTGSSRLSLLHSGAFVPPDGGGQSCALQQLQSPIEALLSATVAEGSKSDPAAGPPTKAPQPLLSSESVTRGSITVADGVQAGEERGDGKGDRASLGKCSPAKDMGGSQLWRREDSAEQTRLRKTTANPHQDLRLLMHSVGAHFPSRTTVGNTEQQRTGELYAAQTYGVVALHRPCHAGAGNSHKSSAQGWGSTAPSSSCVSAEQLGKGEPLKLPVPSYSSAAAVRRACAEHLPSGLSSLFADETNTRSSDRGLGVQEHSSTASTDLALAATSILELLALCATAPEDESGGRPDAAVVNSPRRRVWPAVVRPGVSKHILEHEAKTGLPSLARAFPHKSTSSVEDPTARGPLPSREARISRGEQQCNLHDAITSQHSVTSAATVSRGASCDVVAKKTSGSSNSLPELVAFKKSDTAASSSANCPVVQPHYIGPRGGCLSVWLPAFPGCEETPGRLSYALSGGSWCRASNGGLLNTPEIMETAPKEAALSCTPAFPVLDPSEPALQQAPSQDMTTSALQHSGDGGANRGITCEGICVPLEDTADATDKKDLGISSAGPSQTPSPAQNTRCCGDVGLAQKTPPASARRELSPDHARPQCSSAKASTSCLTLSCLRDRVASPAVLSRLGDGHRQKPEGFSNKCTGRASANIECSRQLETVAEGGIPKAPRNCTPVADIKYLRGGSRVTAETLRIRGADDHDNTAHAADAASHAASPAPLSVPGYPVSELAFVDEAIRKRASDVALRAARREVPDTPTAVHTPRRPARSAALSQVGNRDRPRRDSSKVTTPNSGHNAWSPEIMSPLLIEKAAKDATPGSKAHLSRAHAPSEGRPEQHGRHDQQLPQWQYDGQSKVTRWSQLQLTSDQHGDHGQQLVGGLTLAAHLPGLSAFLGPSHASATQDAATHESPGLPVARCSARAHATACYAGQEDKSHSSRGDALHPRTCFPEPSLCNYRRGMGRTPGRTPEGRQSLEQRHMQSGRLACRPPESLNIDSISLISPLLDTLPKSSTSVFPQKVQTPRQSALPGVSEKNTTALLTSPVPRGPHAQLLLSDAQMSCALSSAADKPRPPPPPPTPLTILPSSAASYCKQTEDESSSLLRIDSGVSAGPSTCNELVEKACEMSWLQVLQGILEQHARRGGGSASDAIAAALAVADASVREAHLTAGVPTAAKGSSAADLDTIQSMPSSPPQLDADGGSAPTGEVGAHSSVSTTGGTRAAQQNAAERRLAGPTQFLAEGDSARLQLPSPKMGRAAVAASAAQRSSECPPSQDVSVSERNAIAAGPLVGDSTSSLYRWMKLQESDGHANADWTAAQGGTCRVTCRSTRGKSDRAAERTEGSTSPTASSVRGGLKPAASAQSSTDVRQQPEEDAQESRRRWELPGCGVAPAAGLLPLREPVKAQEGHKASVVPGEQQRAGGAEGQPIRRRPPRPSKRQRVLIRALAYVKQRLRTLESEVLPLVNPASSAQAAMPAGNDCE